MSGTTQRHDENSYKPLSSPPIRSTTMSAPSNATLMKYIELCNKRRDLLREIKRDKAELEYNLSLIARNEEKLELLHFIRDDDPTSQNRANFRYRKYEPRYSPWNYRSTSQNMAAYFSYKFKPSHSRCLEPPEKHTLLAQWITRSYRFNSGVELLRADNQAPDSSLELLWHHSDAIMCCPLELEPVFTFANLVGLDALGTKLDHLKYMTLTNVIGSKNSFRVQNSAFTAEQDRKYVTIKSRVLYPKFRGRMVSAFLSHHFPEVADYNFTADMENEGVAYLPAGIFGSWRRMGRYDQVLVWKVFNDEGRAHCMAFMFVNTSLLIE